MFHDDPLDSIANVAAIEHVRYVRQCDHHETPGMGRKCRFDPLLDGKERQRIFFIDAMSVAHRDADLSDPPQSLFDQPLMARMKRLVTADEQRGRLLRIECRPEQRKRLLARLEEPAKRGG